MVTSANSRQLSGTHGTFHVMRLLPLPFSPAVPTFSSALPPTGPVAWFPEGSSDGLGRGCPNILR